MHGDFKVQQSPPLIAPPAALVGQRVKRQMDGLPLLSKAVPVPVVVCALKCRQVNGNIVGVVRQTIGSTMLCPRGALGASHTWSTDEIIMHQGRKGYVQ